MQTVIATFENGVLKPAQPLNLPEHTRVRLSLEVLSADDQKKQNQETLAALQGLLAINERTLHRRINSRPTA